MVYFTANAFELLLTCFTCSYPSSFLHPDRSCCTVFLCSPQNLHLSHSTVSMLLFLSFALAMLLLTVFSCSKLQPARVFFTMLLWYFTLKLLLFQNLLFIHSFVLYSRSFSIVSILLSI